MSDTSVIPLGWNVGREGAVLLRQAEWWDPESPFVLIRIEVWGQIQEFGLRLDLDKRVFLDRLNDPDLDESLSMAAEKVCMVVVEQMPH